MSARIRTGYSFRRAAGKLDDVMSRIVEIGLSAAPITDSTTFGWTRWSKLASDNGLKPVFGVEIGVKLGVGDKNKPIIDHWTFIARNSVVPLHQLISRATEQFHYEPLLTIPQALSVPDLFVISGHRFDPDQIPGETPRNFYVGLSPACSAGFIRRAETAAHSFIAVGVNRYPSESQKSLYEVLAGERSETQSYPQHIQSDADWRLSVRGSLPLSDAALQNRDLVLEQSIATLPRGHLPEPERKASLTAMCIEGAKRLGVDLDNPVYWSRLNHELTMIGDKNFSDYFYIVADICTFARSRMMVGPARGSSCGSLVCYLLGITTIDPIPFGLLFERFIDTSRDDLPDIDIDFSEQHRDLVFEYVRQRYGADHVARLGTVNFYQVRSALKETCGALDVPPWKAEPIAAVADEHGIAKALQSDSGVKLLKDCPQLAIAAELEGHPRHAGQHAAGVVITQGPVTDVVAVDRRTGATMCDKYDAEKLNLLKIDALGLTQLSIFEHALQLARLDRNHLFQVSLDDAEAFAVLNAKHFAGVFQFNGKAVQDISKAITVETINDIVAIIALARPGPLNSGAAFEWVRHRRGDSMQKPALHDLLPETFGLIVYQEQVMRIAREIGHMGWADVNALRRIIARTQGVQELAKFREMFVAGAVQHMNDEQADKLWRDIVTFGGYGFNKSHAVTYGIIAYWCCWLKAHHPVEFAAAMLSFVGEDQQLAMLREMEREGVEFVAADPRLSTDKWTVAGSDRMKYLLGPLTNIVGIGPTHCATIIAARARREELTGAVAKALARCQFKIPTTSPVATRIAEIMPDPRARNIITAPTPIRDVQLNGVEHSVVVFGVVDKLKVQDENAPEAVAKRNGRRFDGEATSLRMWINDDEDKIFAKVPHWLFREIGQSVLDRGRAGTAIYAIKGNVPRSFRMIDVRNIKYIGDMEEDASLDDVGPRNAGT